MALCLSSDAAAQERAWFDAQPWERTPAALRKRLTEGEVLAHQSALAHFVGIEDYEAAGGALRRDLFDSDHTCWVCDPDLLRRLAGELWLGLHLHRRDAHHHLHVCARGQRPAIPHGRGDRLAP